MREQEWIEWLETSVPLYIIIDFIQKNSFPHFLDVMTESQKDIIENFVLDQRKIG